MRNRPWLILLLFAALLAAMAAKSLLVSIPDVRSANAAGQFDANRAAARLERILGDERPHAADTAGSDAVRDRLLAELRAAGLTPLVRDQFACNALEKARGVSCARVRNILVTIGPPAGRHLLVNSHYDSTFVGPAAGDAGAGVATMIETAAILKDERLARPVTFLFNEGEELGLVGARAFLESDPLAARVDSLINLEARGVRGPVHMFETSVPNAGPISVYKRAVDRPVANSLSTDVYRLLPNYTDVNSFDERGWLTLNLAMVGNETRYHSPGDNLAALDRATLQHMGDQTLALARELGRGTPDSQGSRIFMDLLSRDLLAMPTALGLTLLELLLLGAAWISWRRKALWRGLATMVGALLLAAALAWLGMWLVGWLRAGMFWRAYPIWTHLAVYASVLLAGVVALGTVGRRLERRQLRPAFWLTFLLLGTLLALIAPGAAVYFIFPPLLALGGMLAKRWWRPAELAGALAAIVALYLTWGAMLANLEELLNTGPMWIFAPLGALILLPALVEARALLRPELRTPLAAASGLVLLGWAAAVAAPAYSEDRQQRFSLERVHDASAGKSWWAVANDGGPLPAAFGDGWKRQKLPHVDARRWARPATGATQPPVASVEKVADVRSGAGRRVRLRLRPNGADVIALVAPKDADIRAAGSGRYVQRIDHGEGEYAIRCVGRSCDGALLDLIVAGSRPLELKIVGLRPGVPPEGAALIAERPRNARPQYSPDQTVTVAKVRV